MKVLILGTRYAPIPNVEGGAIETLVTDYLKYAKNKDDDITVYSAFSKKINKETLSNYTNINFRFIDTSSVKFNFFSAVFGILRRIIKKRFVSNYYVTQIVKDIKKKGESASYDKIIIENELSSIPLIRKKIKGEIISHIHNDYFNKQTPSINIIAKSCDEVWCVSKYIMNRVKETPIDKKKIKLLYNGVDFSKMDTHKNYKKTIEKYNLEESNFIILYVGRIIEEKGVLELIKAFNKIPNNNDEIKLLIVGDKINNKKSKEYYVKVKDESSNNRNIIFAGYIDYENISDLYCISTIQAIPSICQEAFGLIAVEGMYHGLPIIATNTGGLAEIVNDKTGMVIEKTDIVENIRIAIQYFIKNPSNLEKIKIYNKKRALEYSSEKYCENFYKLLHK